MFGSLEVNADHLQVQLKDTCDQPDVVEGLKDVDPMELVKLVSADSAAFADYLHHGVNYSGGQMFANVNAMTPNLEALIKVADRVPGSDVHSP